LLAHEFVLKAEWAVLHAVTGQYDGIGFARTANEPHIAERTLIFPKAEGAGGSDFATVSIGSDIDGELLPADGNGEINIVGNAVAVAGIGLR